MEYYEKALWCSGVPTQVCIAGNGFMRLDTQYPRSGNNSHNLPASRSA